MLKFYHSRIIFSRTTPGEFPVYNKEDEYSNLMTQRERQWIVNIQLNQLKCDNPFLDDYYYTVFNQKSKLTDSQDIKNALKSDKEETKVALSAESKQGERYISYFNRVDNFQLTWPGAVICSH